MNPPATTDLTENLLRFYDASRRTLPWRSDSDPYKVWVSEVMLQQTRVATVIPYFNRWVERFPDVYALADAPADEVLKLWEGLGYYSRARNLHSAAQLVVREHAGRLPDDPDALLQLPGFGAYTSGAVASIAYGVRTPAIDGNVKRVAARMLGQQSPSARGIRDFVAAHIPAQRPGDFNQALMELGATICTPRNPRCAECPVQRDCVAFAEVTQDRCPAPRVRAAVPQKQMISIALVHENEVLLVRRPDTGLLARMWELPAIEVRRVTRAAVQRAAGLVGFDRETLIGPMKLGVVRHELTHVHIDYVLWTCAVADRSLARFERELVWAGRTSAGLLTLPVAQRKLLDLVPALHVELGSESAGRRPPRRSPEPA